MTVAISFLEDIEIIVVHCTFSPILIQQNIIQRHNKTTKTSSPFDTVIQYFLVAFYTLVPVLKTFLMLFYKINS